MSDQAKLEILIDVRSRLDELLKSQEAFRATRQEAMGMGNMLKTGLGIDVARRGLELLTSNVQQYAIQAFHMADAIKDQAKNLDLSNRAYQVMGNLITDAGGDVGLLTQAININNRSLIEARTLGSAAAGAYRTLGLDITKLEQMPIERRMELIGRAVLNATDRTQAYGAAGQILGSRNLPTLLGALKDLATEGWDKVADAQERAGRVMKDDTINRLEAAQKALEKFKQRSTITVGSLIGDAMNLTDAFKRAAAAMPFAVAGSILRPGKTGQLFGGVWNEFIKEPGDGAPAAQKADDGSAAREIALKENLATAEYNLAAAMAHRETIENDPNVTGLSIDARRLDQMQKELRLREQLLVATKGMPLGDTETKQARDLRIKKLEEQNEQLRNQIKRVPLTNQFNDAAQATRDRFSSFNTDRAENKQGVGASMQLGAMDWVTNLGTASQQMAGVMQSTLGSAVNGITDGIMGWINGTKSFGEAMLNLGSTVFQTILQTIVQMGVQWLVFAALGKTSILAVHGTSEVAKAAGTTSTIAQEGAKTPVLMANAAAASAGSFGLSAVIGIALLAALLGAFAAGGFSEGGYTGNMGRGDVAGVVHGQEYVLNAAATARLGTGFLDQVNSGTASAASAPVAFGGAGAAAVQGGGNARESVRNNHFFIDREVFAAAMQQDMRAVAHEVYLSNVRKGA